MKWRTVVTDYFTFTRRERIGVLVLLALISFTFLLPRLLNKNTAARPVHTDTAWMAELRKLEASDSIDVPQKRRYKRDPSAYTFERPTGKTTPATLFPFDPNTLNDEGWRKLGVSDKTILTIRKYLAKGGRFHKPEDLKKVYGLRPDHVARMLPFVTIAEREQPPYPAAKSQSSPARTRASPVDVNTADTAALIALPGIGSKLAQRIVTFRDKLGGFYSVDQVGEVYGLADSVFQKIRRYLTISTPSVKKIDLNNATLDELKIHPYFRYNVAKAIVAYRDEHGPFSNLEELKKIAAMNADIFAKATPYLQIN